VLGYFEIISSRKEAMFQYNRILKNQMVAYYYMEDGNFRPELPNMPFEILKVHILTTKIKIVLKKRGFRCNHPNSFLCTATVLCCVSTNMKRMA
jgi:hypothetical protein